MHVLSLELSTTSAKCILYSKAEGVLASLSRQYPKEASDGLTHDAEGVLCEAFEVLKWGAREACARGIKPLALGLSGTWHSLLMLDKEGAPLGRVSTWADLSGAEAASRARADGKADGYYRRTGCVLHGMYPSWKLATMRASGSKAHAAAARIATETEWVYRALTGEWAVSACLASGGGLLNTHKLDWDDGALSEAGITSSQLSPLTDIFHLGRLCEEASFKSGLPVGLPVSVGGADGALNHLAVGGLDPGVMSMSVGTSGAMRRITPAPKLADTPSTWCYNATADRWLAGAAVNNATNCVDWLVTQMGGTAGFAEDYARLAGKAASIDRKDAPYFMPFLYGERCPGWREDRTGGFIGLKAGHSQGEMYYAVLEGVAFNMYQCYLLLRGLAGEPARTIVSGGITNSPLWMQMAADVFGIELETTGAQNDSTVGAALVAIEALEKTGRIAAPAASNPKSYRPDGESSGLLAERFGRYLEYYRELATKG